MTGIGWNPIAMKYRYYSFLLWLSLIYNLTFQTVQAQDTVRNGYYNSRLDSITSGILNQKRMIQVFVPSWYKPGSADTYDVMYVLDGGNWNTGPISRIQQFLSDERYVPPMIIVSVLGIDRGKDLTPTPMENWRTSGGGDNFLRFIKEELIPHVNSNYPSNKDNTLWGHSLGGMFAIYMLLREPDLFKSYIAVDPSMWWDKNHVIKLAADRLGTLAGHPVTLFISGRNEEGRRSMMIDSLDAVLRKHAPTDLSWKIVSYPDESHSSIRFKTTYDGLRYTYEGLTSGIVFHPQNGLVLRDKPIKLWYVADTTNARYTVDGSIPLLATSARAEQEITLTSGGKVTYKRFSRRSRYDQTATGIFTVAETLRPTTKQKNLKPGGFAYRYYEGEWDAWPDFKKLKPVSEGITNRDFNPDAFPRKKNYALTVDGFFESKQVGYYIFVLEGDNGTRFYLGDRLLMEWTGSYTYRNNSYIVPLAKGFYPFRVEYVRKNPDFTLRMSYITPDGLSNPNPVPIPEAVQYRR